MRRLATALFLVLCLAIAIGCNKQEMPDEPNQPADIEQPTDETGADNENGNENGTTSPVTTPAGSVKVGNVELDPAEVEARQARVDAGEDLWLLDPLEVAKREAPQFGFSDSATFHLISQKEAGEGSGTGEAIVQVVNNGNLYFIQLIQPNGPGENSIWWINAVLRDAK